MLTKELRQTIMQLNQKGSSVRKIAKLLKCSRNTVRSVLEKDRTQSPEINNPEINAQNNCVEKNQKTHEQTFESDSLHADLIPVIRTLFTRAQGNAVRIQELLKDEHDVTIAYSTLTRFIQSLALREPLRRVGDYGFEPGEEMQHDTSPHWVVLDGVRVKAQCASLVFAYSRKLFMQYYPCFTRFEAKIFLKSALEFMEGSCRRCVIDNTHVVLSGGSGVDAVIAPEMALFARMFGFEFIAHRIGNPDRKAYVERGFHYAEKNFLPGRTFTGWKDLNNQAKTWCIEVANQKEKRSLGKSSEAAFLLEKSHLLALPEVLPPIYKHVARIVDTKGFINLNSNQYSVPENLIGKTLDVYQYQEEIRIAHQHKTVATHPRGIGQRREINRLDGHHTKTRQHQTNQALTQTNAALCGHDETLTAYTHELKKHTRGGGLRALNRLLNLKRTYPSDAFLSAIQQAYRYGLYDLNRLEELIIKTVAGNYFTLNPNQEHDHEHNPE
jgi:transposase